ncbi:MAG: tripartite tricarboxylate transporter TctB family protein, partial [Pseudomonadota bacterium]|nr:tripartite tricarboxylate transporter TctB family protein [Pseudomonadota bacterium]
LAGRAKRLAGPVPNASPSARAGDASISDMADEDRPQGLRSVARAGGMLLLGIGYLLIVRFLGYVPSIALLMIAATLYLGTPFSWRVPAIGVAGALVYWLVFVWLLGIPLPAGRLAELF